MNDFIRTKEMLTDIAQKINKLIVIYANKEGLSTYLVFDEISILNVVDSVFSLGVYRIDIVKYCLESKDGLMKEYHQTVSSFASTEETEKFLSARYFPDYLTIKSIFTTLLYNIPRTVQKSDFEYLNKLYKKYNVKF